MFPKELLKPLISESSVLAIHASQEFRYGLQHVNLIIPRYPDCLEYLSDIPGSGFGVAFYSGLTPEGCPRVSARQDYMIYQRIALHELGHGYQDIVFHLWKTSNDPLNEFYQARGFPGRWEDQAAEYKRLIAEGKTYQAWRLHPSEQWAENFQAGFVQALGLGPVEEWTENFGVPLDPEKILNFFKKLAEEGIMPTEEQVREWIAESEQRQAEKLAKAIDNVKLEFGNPFLRLRAALREAIKTD